MPSVLAQNFLRVLYAGNMAYHTSAFIHFSFRQPLMISKLSTRQHSKTPSIASSPAGDEWHYDIMAYLGYINVPYALLAGQRLYRLIVSEGSEEPSETDLDILALCVLAAANASQAYGNFARSRGSGRWIMGEGWDRITVLDALFTVLDVFAVWKLVKR
ncbi:hypothetical protein N0V90_012997 [Kalmusia sp. IMI 367209]|nr:hypothetical protein N0V90_012997 [Kalmusia sp. IMI 367209]